MIELRLKLDLFFQALQIEQQIFDYLIALFAIFPHYQTQMAVSLANQAWIAKVLAR